MTESCFSFQECSNYLPAAVGSTKPVFGVQYCNAKQVGPGAFRAWHSLRPPQSPCAPWPARAEALVALLCTPAHPPTLAATSQAAVLPGSRPQPPPLLPTAAVLWRRLHHLQPVLLLRKGAGERLELPGASPGRGGEEKKGGGATRHEDRRRQIWLHNSLRQLQA